MKILIYGGGVIGSLHATKFFDAGYEVSVYARGKRLEALKDKGLLIFENGKKRKVGISFMDTLSRDAHFDFIFLTIRAEHIEEAALYELKANCSPTIITMVNSMGDYKDWEGIVGKGRILPAFPGAGGSIENDVLHAKLTPSIIQPTTFAELDGRHTKRTEQLKTIFKKSKIPFQMVKNMQHWQISHLALVIPMADAYYMANNAKFVFQEKNIMQLTAKTIKNNFQKLAKRKQLSPFKFYFIKACPTGPLRFCLEIVYKSSFGDLFMYRHSMKAKQEMKRLHDELYAYLEGDGRKNV